MLAPGGGRLFGVILLADLLPPAQLVGSQLSGGQEVVVSLASSVGVIRPGDGD